MCSIGNNIIYYYSNLQAVDHDLKYGFHVLKYEFDDLKYSMNRHDLMYGFDEFDDFRVYLMVFESDPNTVLL